MSALYVIVLAVHVVVCLFLILVVLLQTGKSADIASAFGGGGGTQTVFGPRASSTVLSKATTWSAIVFMLTSIALVLLSQQSAERSVLTGASVPASSTPATPAAPAPATPAPATPAQESPAPAAPVPPSGK